MANPIDITKLTPEEINKMIQAGQEGIDEKRNAVMDQIQTLQAELATLDQQKAAYRVFFDTLSGKAPSTRSATKSGGRRSGVKTDVLAVIAQHPDGISRAAIIEAMSAKGDKTLQGSISNTLATAKKKGEIAHSADTGLYSPAA